MSYLFTSESVSEGHPGQGVRSNFWCSARRLLAQEAISCGWKTLVTTGKVVVAGEVRSNVYVIGNRWRAIPFAVLGLYKERIQLRRIPAVFYGVDELICWYQSGALALGEILAQGAGDQGMMFGYATDETENYMPLTLDLAHTLVYTLARIRHEGKQMTWLRPDAKSQVTIEYDDNNRPLRIDTIVVSTQHDPDVSQSKSVRIHHL